MVIWRITGESIGPNDCGAAHFATKEQATAALREHVAWCREQGFEARASGPEKLVIANRDQLAEALNEAMGYGGS